MLEDQTTVLKGHSLNWQRLESRQSEAFLSSSSLEASQNPTKPFGPNRLDFVKTSKAASGKMVNGFTNWVKAISQSKERIYSTGLPGHG